MADTLGVSAAQLSAMELGNRTIQDSIVQKIKNMYKFSPEIDVQHLADISQPSMKMDLKPANDKQRETMVMFARAFTELSNEQLQSVQDLLNNDRK